MASRTELRTEGAVVIDLDDGDVELIVRTLAMTALDLRKRVGEFRQQGVGEGVLDALLGAADAYDNLSSMLEEADTVIWPSDVDDLDARQLPPYQDEFEEDIDLHNEAARERRTAGEPTDDDLEERFRNDIRMSHLADTVAEMRGER